MKERWKYGSTGVHAYSTIYILKGVWKYRSTSLQHNMYIKGSMEVQEYKFTVHFLYKREYGSTGVQVYSTICILKGV